MFICICNAIDDQRVDQAIRDGHDTAEAIHAALGTQPQCCKCFEIMDDMAWRAKGDLTTIIAAE